MLCFRCCTANRVFGKYFCWQLIEKRAVFEKGHKVFRSQEFRTFHFSPMADKDLLFRKRLHIQQSVPNQNHFEIKFVWCYPSIDENTCVTSIYWISWKISSITKYFVAICKCCFDQKIVFWKPAYSRKRVSRIYFEQGFQSQLFPPISPPRPSEKKQKIPEKSFDRTISRRKKKIRQKKSRRKKVRKKHCRRNCEPGGRVVAPRDQKKTTKKVLYRCKNMILWWYDVFMIQSGRIAKERSPFKRGPSRP